VPTAGITTQKGKVCINSVRFYLSDKGSTYLALLVALMVMGIMLGRAGTVWKQVMQREREEELLFRGAQIQDAIRHWHTPQGSGEHIATPLHSLQDLLKDPRRSGTVRYLRRLYQDPISNSDWNLIRDPARGIVGVASPSKELVIKKDNFPEQLQNLAHKTRYEEWQFMYQPAAQAASAENTHLSGGRK
jgi:type II secretory pathway pseudopilin PulG